MGSYLESFNSVGSGCCGHWQTLSGQVMKNFVVCVAVLVAVASASYPPRPPLYYGPSHRGGYGGAGGLGGLDPLTLLLLQKGGGLGGKGKGSFNPLLLALLGKCDEKYPLGCTQPAVANVNGKRLCGKDSGSACDDGNQQCWPCCTCPNTPSATTWP